MSRHVVIFSHGFGVRKDSRGMFTEIAAALPDCECVLFDYCRHDAVANTDIVPPPSEQAKIFSRVLRETMSRFPNATIDLVTHSMGALPPSLCLPRGIRKTIFLAPPFSLDRERTASWFRDRPGSVLDFSGVSRLARRDGSTTLVPAAYWEEFPSINPPELYNSFAAETDLTVIIAAQDELIRRLGVEGLSSDIELVEIPGNHNFDPPARPKLVSTAVDMLEVV
jgi:hypothetical protein